MAPVPDERAIMKGKLQTEAGDSFLCWFTEDPFKSAFNINSKKWDKLKKYIEAG